MVGGKNKIVDKPKNKFKRKHQGIKMMVEYKIRCEKNKSKLTSNSQKL